MISGCVAPRPYTSEDEGGFEAADDSFRKCVGAKTLAAELFLPSTHRRSEVASRASVI
jgi:hypothetical protein